VAGDEVAGAGLVVREVSIVEQLRHAPWECKRVRSSKLAQSVGPREKRRTFCPPQLRDRRQISKPQERLRFAVERTLQRARVLPGPPEGGHYVL
jgi:hypothetical protein